MSNKVDHWSNRSVAIATGILLLWVLTGTAFLQALHPAAGASYLLLWIAQYVSCRYLVCTRCYYYGKKCYMLGGTCASYLFKERQHGPRMPDDAIVGAWWAVVTLFPIPFFVAWGTWGFLLIYGIVALVWHALHYVLACRRCKNVTCLLNPDRPRGPTAILPPGGGSQEPS